MPALSNGRAPSKAPKLISAVREHIRGWEKKLGREIPHAVENVAGALPDFLLRDEDEVAPAGTDGDTYPARC